MKNYRALIISILLLMLATGLYGDSDDQPRWNTTIFGALDFGGSNKFYGFGVAAGYSFTPRLELEGEAYHMISSYLRYTGLSAALLANYHIARYKVSPYILGGVSIINWSGWGSTTYLMWGGGVKRDITESLKIRFDLRFHIHLDGESDFWMKLFTGLMWTF